MLCYTEQGVVIVYINYYKVCIKLKKKLINIKCKIIIKRFILLVDNIYWYICNYMYCLIQDLLEYFEDNMSIWMIYFLILLSVDNKILQI